MATPAQYRAKVADDFRAATAVFRGEVVAVNAYDLTFRVDTVWKGPAGQTVSLGSGSTPGAGELVLTNTCQSFDANSAPASSSLPTAKTRPLHFGQDMRAD